VTAKETCLSNPRVPYRFGSDTSSLPPLDGKTLLVQFIMNVEVWRFDQKMPRTMTTPPHGVDQIPDVPNFCWAEYGMRVGMARLIEEFSSRGIAIGASINAAVIDVYPQCAEAMLKADWEFIGHGMFQKQIVGEPVNFSSLSSDAAIMPRSTSSKSSPARRCAAGSVRACARAATPPITWSPAASSTRSTGMWTTSPASWRRSPSR
jgi:hypothetical protein